MSRPPRTPPSGPSGCLEGVAAGAALLVASVTAALDPARPLTQYGHDVWQIEQGLPQNSVRSLVQTSDGYLWLGTYEGLVRFDGSRFTVYNKRTVSAIKNNGILSLFEDGDKTLWASTYEGGLVTQRDGVFVDVGSSVDLPGPYVLAVASSGGATWLGTFGGGLVRLRGGAGSLVVERVASPSDRVTCLLGEEDGTVWVGTEDAGLGRYRDGSWSLFTASEGLGRGPVRCVLRSRDGTVWVGTDGGGLSHLDDGRITTLTRRDGLAHDTIHALAEDREGNLWIGTNGGLSRLSSGRITSLTTANGLSNDVVLSTLVDREGSLWVGTAGGGLNRLRDRSVVAFTRREGLTDEDVRVLFEDRDGDLWVGNEQTLDLIRDELVIPDPLRGRLARDRVFSVGSSRDGSLWVGTRGSGLHRVRTGGTRLYRETDGLTDDVVTAVLEDRRGRLWVGTRSAGLCFLDGDRFSPLPDAPELAASQVTCLAEGLDGSLWIGTVSSGLFRLRGGALTRYGAENGFTGANVFSLYPDPRGALWVGTYGDGLFRFSGERFDTVDSRRGLCDDVVYQILEDGGGRLWMSSNNGIFAVALADLEDLFAGRSSAVACASFDQVDGMPSRECNGGYQGAGCRSRDGRLWFPTIRGVAMVDPRRLAPNPDPPPVVVEEVLVDGRVVGGGAPATLLPGSRNLEIRYTALSFLAPAKVRFRYRLDGFDDGWQEAGARRAAYYSELPPGRYLFRVTACNGEGVWNEAGASLALEQQPRFHQTAWFTATCSLGLLATVFGAYALRVRGLKRRQAVLERQVRARTSELASANALLESQKQQLEQANTALERLSVLDPLTDIANRRQLDHALDFEWRRGCRAGQPLALVMVDIDHFKAYNDAYGHRAGDECLKRVAGALAATVTRAGDLAARYGGEEFAILMPATDLRQAEVVAERIRNAVEALAIPHRRSATAPVVTLSLGAAAVVPTLEDRPESLVAAADGALYAAKRAGRNRVATATPSET